MGKSLDSIIEGVIAAEGGYSNNPKDPGGETMFGITQAVARANGYTGRMIDMPKLVAVAIYRKRYIIEPGFDKVWLCNNEIGVELVDTGVNMGPTTAAIYLQRALNGFNNTGSKYASLFVDGNIGPVTLDALNAYIKWRKTEGVTVMLRLLNSLQAVSYLTQVEANPNKREFIYGWILNRVEI